MNPSKLITLSNARGCNLSGMPRGGSPTFTIAEIGQACAGLGEPYLSAIFYRNTGGNRYYYRLKHELWSRLLNWVDRERYPRKVAGEKWTERLVCMVLEEEISPRINDMARAMVMQVSDRTWRRRFDKPHKYLAGLLDVWVGEADRHVRRKLR